MLNELYIENLAVIKQASIPFSNDFNVFTGETGAGKSILINGINAVLGRRTYKDIVRSGCNKAVITAVFTGLSNITKEKLNELGIDLCDDELIISREIYADGGSSARINSKPSNISVIREIGSKLIDIHGQHDNQILMFPEKHLEIIDNFAGLDKKVTEYTSLFKQLQETARQLKKLSSEVKFKNERIEILKNIINEIGSLEIDDCNEDTALEEEFMIANNSTLISVAINETDKLIIGDEDLSGICETLDNIINKLSHHLNIIPDFEIITKRLENTKIELYDINSDILKINDTIDIDEERFSYIQNRREQLISIKKKYGPELIDVISKYKNAVDELNSIITSSDEIDIIGKKKNELLMTVTEKASELSALRVHASVDLVKKIEKELYFLDMPNVKFVFEHKIGKLTTMGMDSFQMLLSVNLGEEPKPISKIASGGELSRIMLAIKNVTAEKDDVPTLIFDEIDTGVSGRAAQKIGVKLRQISKFRQVICVTHLSQIAVMADNHLLIQKETVDDKTITSVNKIDIEQRKHEIARILSGEHITLTSLKNAEEQLNSKDEICNDIISKYSK